MGRVESSLAYRAAVTVIDEGESTYQLWTSVIADAASALEDEILAFRVVYDSWMPGHHPLYSVDAVQASGLAHDSLLSFLELREPDTCNGRTSGPNQLEAVATKGRGTSNRRLSHYCFVCCRSSSRLIIVRF